MSYARLGITCDTSNRVLIDNTKFFSMNSDIYKKYWVKMMEYPAQDQPFIYNIGDIDRPEELKTGGPGEEPDEISVSSHTNKAYTHLNRLGCCGKK